MKFKDKIFDAIKGFFIGTALLIPGVSAASVALICKIYQKIVNNIANLTKSFLSSFKALIPIGIGVVVAILAMWIPLKLATEHILFAMVCLFAGAMIGGVPDIAKNIHKEQFKPRYYLYFLFALLIGAALGIISCKAGINTNELFNPIGWKLYLIIVLIGLIASMGVVVPGISGSMLLLVLGFYTNILKLVDQIKVQPGPVIGVLLLMAVGVILGIVCFSKLMKILFAKFNQATFVWIVGLVVGSIFSLYYNPNIIDYYNHGIMWWEYLLGFIFIIGGIIGSYILTLKQNQPQNV